jgi:hypothetical protein
MPLDRIPSVPHNQPKKKVDRPAAGSNKPKTEKGGLS